VSVPREENGVVSPVRLNVVPLVLLGVSGSPLGDWPGSASPDPDCGTRENLERRSRRTNAPSSSNMSSLQISTSPDRPGAHSEPRWSQQALLQAVGYSCFFWCNSVDRTHVSCRNILARFSQQPLTSVASEHTNGHRLDGLHSNGRLIVSLPSASSQLFRVTRLSIPIFPSSSTQADFEAGLHVFRNSSAFLARSSPCAALSGEGPSRCFHRGAGSWDGVQDWRHSKRPMDVWSFTCITLFQNMSSLWKRAARVSRSEHAYPCTSPPQR
jgi:hypothetical protein